MDALRSWRRIVNPDFGLAFQTEEIELTTPNKVFFARLPCDNSHVEGQLVGEASGSKQNDGLASRKFFALAGNCGNSGQETCSGRGRTRARSLPENIETASKTTPLMGKGDLRACHSWDGTRTTGGAYENTAESSYSVDVWDAGNSWSGQRGIDLDDDSASQRSQQLVRVGCKARLIHLSAMNRGRSNLLAPI